MTNPESIVINYNNYVDSSYYTVVFQKGDWPDPTNLDQLKDRFFVHKAESADAALDSTKFEVALGASRLIKTLSIPDHTITRRGRVRHRITKTSKFSQATVKTTASGAATSMSVQLTNGACGNFMVGDKFMVEGDSTIYTVTTSDLQLGENLLIGPSDELYFMDRMDSTGIDDSGFFTDSAGLEGPDHTISGYRITEDFDDGGHNFAPDFGGDEILFEDGSMCFSVFVRKGTRPRISLQIRDDSDAAIATAHFDLSTGTMISSLIENWDGTPYDPLTDGAQTTFLQEAGIYPCGNNWYRCYVSAFSSAPAPSFVYTGVQLRGDNGELEYQGDGKYIGMCKPMLNRGDTPKRYVPSPDSAVLEDFDGTLTFTPGLAGSTLAGKKITALSGDFISFGSIAQDWTDVWNDAYKYGTLKFGHPSFFDLKIDPERAQNYRFPYFKVYDEAVLGAFVEVEVNDTQNETGTVAMSRLWISDGWEPPFNIDYGASVGVEQIVDISSGITGADFYNPVGKQKTIRGTISNIPVDESLQQPFEIMQDSGMDKQVFVIFNKNDTTNRHRRSFLATFRTLNPVEFPNFDANRVAVEFKEVIA